MKLDKTHIAQLAEQHKGWLEASDLLESGVSFKQIRQLVAAGELTKLGPGLYHRPGFDYDERIETARRIPVGVFCLYSACIFHDLSNFVPSVQHLAVPKKSRYVLPEYPPIKLYYWEQKSFELGIVEYPLGEGSIRVYDPEKTVCDLLRLRRKSEPDTLNEVLKNYLQSPHRNIAKLHDYAWHLRVENIIKQYLNILL